jgi:molybdopterin converting factor small subunit
MLAAIVRLNGLLAKGIKSTYVISFEGKRIKLETALSKIPVEVPKKVVAFVAINGTKAVKDDWVNDGDIIDIFPVVTGG